MNSYEIETVESRFTSKGDRCDGSLWLPKGVSRPPVIVMAHGFGAIRDVGLRAFAERFSASGYAVYAFDYRGFGHSEGEPRQWVSPHRQLLDWAAAIAHVRALPQVDGERLALWGVSLSGGHVLQTAAHDHGVRAVIAQVPHVSGPASIAQVPPLTLPRLSLAGIRDLIGGAFGKPHYAATVGRPGDVAALSAPGAWEGYVGMVPEGAPWENRARARVFLELPFYSPIRHVRRIKAPTLILAGSRDTIVPARSARIAAERIPNGRFALLDTDHFELHSGEAFERNISLQLAFLDEVLPAANVAASRHQTGGKEVAA